jgi:hypothetical protein
VEVWENERLDPVVASKSGSIPGGAYSSRHLRAGERAPWVKVKTSASFGQPSQGDQGGETAWLSAGEAVPETGTAGDASVLALKRGWEYVPGEDWRVDVCGLWSEVGVNEGGSGAAPHHPSTITWCLVDCICHPGFVEMACA